MMHNALRHTKLCCPHARIARSRGSLAALVLCCVLSGCASLHGGERGEPDDPLEPLNRAVFDANTALDDAIIRPLAEAYRTIVPPFVRDRIRSAIDNLAEPRIFVNDLLQRRPDAAGITFARFFLNTTAGLGGMFWLLSAFAGAALVAVGLVLMYSRRTPALTDRDTLYLALRFWQRVSGGSNAGWSRRFQPAITHSPWAR